MNLNCTLLCASGAAYDIDPATGVYTPDSLFSKAVNYSAPGPTAISSTGAIRVNACLVGRNADGIIVAFRGTIAPGSPGSFQDWLEDFFDLPVTCGTLPGKVHAGFCAAVNSIMTGVIGAVNSLDPSSNPVYVTGHSKGGAMASIGAYLLTQARIPVKQVVTFASPKPGDADFKTGYQNVIANQIRYENYGDIVPLVPPADEFIPFQASLLKRIPDIGQHLAMLVNQAAGWNYQPVGSELFIESATHQYQINTQERGLDQMLDVALNLVEDPAKWPATLADAHSLHCTFGYMSGTCPPSVCQ